MFSQWKYMLLFFFILTVDGYLDVFLDKKDVYRLFGIMNSQLYYVRNGTVNKNAMDFVGHVDSNDDDDIQFTWRSTSGYDVLYDMEILENNQFFGVRDDATPSTMEKENMKLLYEDEINKTESGNISDQRQKFVYNLACSGLADGHVFIEMKFTFYFHMGNDTMLLRRVKYCTKKENVTEVEETDLSSGMVESNSANVNRNNDVPMNHNGNGDSTQAFFISVSVFTTLIFVFVFVVAIMHCRSTRRNTDGGGPVSCHIGPEGPEIFNQCLKPDLPNNVAATRTIRTTTASGGVCAHFTQSHFNDLGDGSISDLTNKLADISIDRHEIASYEIVMKGTFARICNGTLNCGTAIYIKTVTGQATNMQKKLLIAEASLLKNLNHPNLLRIEHITFNEHQLPMIIYPFVTEGRNLKCYLQGINSNIDKLSNNLYSRNRSEQITSQDLVEMSIQISSAMEYLSSCGVVHQDLATRNCIVGFDGFVKVTDNSLSRDIFPADYCCLGDNENRPVRWLALESLIHHIYTSASDVWSFGVVLWELQSLGGLPYIDIDDFEMENSLRDGYRLSRPLSCPEYLYSLMVRCWHYSPRDRPTFAKLRKNLSKFQDELIKYV